jgi:hypothetical protein
MRDNRLGLSGLPARTTCVSKADSGSSKGCRESAEQDKKSGPSCPSLQKSRPKSRPRPGTCRTPGQKVLLRRADAHGVGASRTRRDRRVKVDEWPPPPPERLAAIDASRPKNGNALAWPAAATAATGALHRSDDSRRFKGHRRRGHHRGFLSIGLGSHIAHAADGL